MMADDIDIEEHDILENPRVKDILPNIDSIKSEPLDIEDPTEEYENYNNYESYQDSFQEDQMDFEYTEAQEMTHFQPTSEPSEVFQLSNKIILGTKPCPRPEDCDIRDVDIVLEDWGERLHNSNCFCKECKTLFATRNALDAHNMTAHSFLVAVDTPEVNEPAENTSNNSRFCNHCQVLFNDDNLLIQHLYELITAKNAKKTEITEHVVVPIASTSNPAVNQFLTYTCPICYFRYRDKSYMEIHITCNHGSRTEVPPIAPFDPICRICNQKYVNLQSYNRHIRQMHYSYFKKKENVALKIKSSIKQQLLGQSRNIIAPKFKCGICKCAFLTSKSAKFHHNTSHPNEELNIKRVVPYVPKTVLASKIKKSKPYPKRQVLDEEGLYPSKVLFKCSKCQIHFMSCTTALCHSANCREGINHFKCTQCNKVFRVKDLKLHELQHKYTNKFKVFVTHTNIYSRVLCRCPKCEVCFEERSFISHLKVGCKSTKNFAYCSICKLNINNIPIHNQNHINKNFIKSDFIIIDEFIPIATKSSVSVNNELVPLKRKAVDEPEKLKPAKIQKVLPAEQKKFMFYYCKSCKTYVKFKKRQNFHIAESCKNFKKKQHCTMCGLLFCGGHTLRNHMKWHLENNAEIKDFSFATIANFKRFINPPMPEFPFCHKCGVHYLSNDKRFHGCKTERKMCEICHKTFNDHGYTMHMLHHKYLKKDVAGKGVENELIQKYASLKPVWNILYKCEICDVTTDSYDRVVEHCQKHYNNMESYDVTIRNCHVCLLQLEEPCYKRHVELHVAGAKTRESFKILNYNYLQFLTNDWLKFLEPLPIDEVQQILSRSIYYVVRSVKMTLAVDGPPEYTVYKCETCETFVKPTDIRLHTKRCHELSNKTRSIKCKFCKLPFSSLDSKKDHEKVHQTFKINADSFRVVTFHGKFDTEFNMKLESENRISRIPTPHLVKALEGPKLKVALASKTFGKKYRYYECQKCKTCTPRVTTISNHVCLDKKHSRVCTKCKHVFTYRSIYKHMIRHENLKDLTRANIIIVPFNEDKADKNKAIANEEVPTNDETIAEANTASSGDDDINDVEKSTTGDEKVVIIYKCSCGLHFTSQKTIEKHFSLCTPDNRLSAEKCSKCGLLFPTELLVSHLCNHHTGGNSKIKVKTIPTVTLYRCGCCKCLFMSKKQTYNHRRHCKPNKSNGEECDVCGLLFHKNVLSAHRFKHKYNTGLENRPCRIVTVWGPKYVPKHSQLRSYPYEPKTAESQIDENVYRCAKCDLHFVPYTAWLYHISNNHIVHACIDCDECGLKFAANSLRKHKFSHHTKGQKGLEGFNVTTVEDPVPSNFKTLGSAMNCNNENVVYKCENCDLHFLNIWSLNSHYLRNHIIAVPTVNCKECGLKFTEKSLIKHEALHHVQNKYTIKDLCIVPIEASSFRIKNQFCNNTSVAKLPQENKLDLTEVKTRVPIYKCHVCGLHYLERGSLKDHLRVNDHNKIPNHCEQCGLTFSKISLSKHIALHHERDNLTRDQFQILNYLNMLYKDAAVNDSSIDITLDENTLTNVNVKINLFRCKDCDLHFISSTGISRHFELKHNTRSKVCENCNLKFALNSLHLHITEHHDNLNCTMESFNISEIGEDTLVTQSGSITEPHNEHSCFNSELEETTFIDTSPNRPHSMKFTKYLDKTIFKCGICDIHYLSQKSLKNHFVNKHRISRDCVNCTKCGLRFSIMAIKNHTQLHHGSCKLQKLYVVCIDPVTYKPIKTYTVAVKDSDETLAIAVNDSAQIESTPETVTEMVNKITDTFSPTPPVNSLMKLYKCGICDIHYLSQKSLRYHFDNKHIHIRDCINCTKCGLRFSVMTINNHMQLHHKTCKIQELSVVSIDPVTYRPINTSTVTFKDREETLTNTENDSAQIESAPETVTEMVNKIAAAVSPTPPEDSLIELYKCGICDIHYLSQKALKYHFDNKHILVRDCIKCTICGLRFSVMTIKNHTRLHHKSRKIQELSVVSIDPVTCKPIDTNTVSFNYSEETLDITENDCAQIESTPETDSEVVNKITDTVSPTPPVKSLMKLFKCGICGCHFSQTEFLTMHIRYGTHDVTCLSECQKCGLLFSTKYMPRHIKLHHKSGNESRDDFEIIEKGTLNESSLSLNLNESVVSSMDVNTSGSSHKLKPTKNHRFKLYKCFQCNVFFLNQNICYKHCVKHILMDPKEYIGCKLCGFQFRIAALSVHMKKHHKDDFNLDEVLVEEYLPDASGKVPKIDIYFAIDKVQSGLVSTTTDDKEVNSTQTIEEVVQESIDNKTDNSSNDKTSENPPTVPQAETIEIIPKEEQNILPNVPQIETKEPDQKENSKAIGENTMVIIPTKTETEIKDEDLNNSLTTESELNNSIEIDEQTTVEATGSQIANENDVLEIEDEVKTEFPCSYCDEKFKNNTSREFHESLDHLDALKDCPICGKSLNTSILNELHLRIKRNHFTCCICNKERPLTCLVDHSNYHKASS